MSYHAYVDKSKRKPYQCGVCGRDITHPVHQPDLPGVAPVRPPEPEPVVYVDAWYPEPKRDPPQMGLFA